MALGHLDELQKAEKYPIRCSLQTGFTVPNFNTFTPYATETGPPKIVPVSDQQGTDQGATAWETLNHLKEQVLISTVAKCGVDPFRISSLKAMAVEIYKILNEMSPEYLSLLSKSSIPYSLWDDNKLIQQKMKTTTFGLTSFTYYGAHLWN